jgi:predicted enzyme related to lactoylglutathione lyase
MTRLDSVILQVSDTDRSTAFYADLFDFTPNEARSYPPEFRYLETGGGALILQRIAPGASPAVPTSMEIGISIDNADSLSERIQAAWPAHLIARRDMDWGSAIDVIDPDGHRLAAYELRLSTAFDNQPALGRPPEPIADEPQPGKAMLVAEPTALNS